MGDKISEDDKKTIQDAVDDLKEKNKSTDLDAIKSSMEELNKAWSSVSEKLYQQSQQTSSEQTDAGSSESAGQDSNVEDADFEVVDEK